MTKKRRTRGSVLAVLTAAMLIFSASVPAMAFDGEATPNEPAAVEETAPIQKEAPVEKPAPVQETAPAEKPAPVEKPAPAQEAAPAEEAAPAQEAAPAEEAVPAQEEAPVENAAPAEEAKAEEKAPAEEAKIEEAAPVEEAAQAREASPVMMSAPAEAEEIAAEDPDDDSWGYGNKEKTVKWRLVDKEGKQTLVFEVEESASTDEQKAITGLLFNDSHAGDKFARESLAGIVEAIVIPKAVTGIGWKARYSNEGSDLYDDKDEYPINQKEAGVFQYFKKLTDVEIEEDNAIVRIGWSAFRQCTSLTSFDFTKLVNLEEILNQAFSPSGIKEADLSACTNLKKIYKSAFYESSIEKVVLPEGLEVIGYKAFENTKIDEVTVPESVTKIYDYAFNNCKQLGKLAFENAANIEFVGARAFSGTGRAANQLNPYTEVTDEASNTTAATRKTAADMFSKIAGSAFDFTGLSKNEKNEFSTATFVDEDGSTILEKTDYATGGSVEYSGKTPEKAATAEYTYEFDGWTLESGEEGGNVTYKANYKAAEIVAEEPAAEVEEDIVEDKAAPEIAEEDAEIKEASAETANEDADNEVAEEDAEEIANADAETEIRIADASSVSAAAAVRAAAVNTASSAGNNMIAKAVSGARPAVAKITRAADTGAVAEFTGSGQTAEAGNDLVIEEQDVPLANAAPMTTENTSSIKVMPAFIVLLGISLTLILRKKEEEEDII